MKNINARSTYSDLLQDGFRYHPGFLLVGFREFFTLLETGSTGLQYRGGVGIAHLQGGLGGRLEEGGGSRSIASLEFLFGELGLAVFSEGEGMFLDGGIDLGLPVAGDGGFNAGRWS